ncbi:MAG: hypothetical protein KBT34_03110 [Prevotella sp.]|nr:hypothetical protein [Candidatus Prevotella equi]
MTREEIKEALDNKQIVCYKESRYRVQYDLFNEIMVIDVRSEPSGSLLTFGAEKDCYILKNS